MKRFFTPELHSSRASLGLLALRLLAGIALMHHGWGKIQHPFGWMGPDAGTPAFLQALAALSEFGGGLLFREDPRARGLTLRAVGYAEP